MPLNQGNYTTLIILSVGDNAAGTLAANIDLLWAAHEDVTDLALRALFVKLDAIDLMLGDVRRQVDTSGLDGASVKLDQLSKHLLDMRTQTELAIGQAMAGAGGGIAVGALTRSAPIMRDSASQPDPNSRIYRGDPLKRRGGRVP